MVLTRVIGFKEQMPGIGQWNMLTQAEDSCWHCDQWIYTLIFWDAETIGHQAKKTTHHKVLNQMVKLVEQMNPDIREPDSLVSLSVYDEDATDFSNQDSVDYQPERTVDSPSPRRPAPERSPPEPEEESEGSDETDREAPLLFGSFNNWKGQPMLKLDDFVEILAKKYGRQNQAMHQDFQTTLSIMRK